MDAAVAKGTTTIKKIAAALAADGPAVNRAIGMFRLAVASYDFAGSHRLRRQAAAACLYVALRRAGEPRLLVELSDHLNVTVFSLGTVFLCLCQALGLDSHAIARRPVGDPSLVAHRLSDRLLGRGDARTSAAALRVVASMKRETERSNWFALCAAATYVLAAARGQACSKAQVESVVDDGMAALSKRLTVAEFVSMAAELKHSASVPSADGQLICEHKDAGRPRFAHGLCEECYDLLVEISEMYDDESGDSSEEEDVASWSDIDDREIVGYLNGEEERRCKEVIWEQMNREYIDEQAAKKMVLARGAGAEAKPRERKRTRDKGAKDSAGAEKSLKKPAAAPPSTRINYQALERLYAEDFRQQTAGVSTESGSNGGEADRNDDEGNSAGAQNGDCYDGAGNEGYDGEGDYNEHYGDGDDDYLEDDFGF